MDISSSGIPQVAPHSSRVGIGVVVAADWEELSSVASASSRSRSSEEEEIVGIFLGLTRDGFLETTAIEGALKPLYLLERSLRRTTDRSTGVSRLRLFLMWPQSNPSSTTVLETFS